MRLLAYTPLAYLAGLDGIALFIPYLVLLLGVAYFLRTRTARRNAASSSSDQSVDAISLQLLVPA